QAVGIHTVTRCFLEPRRGDPLSPRLNDNQPQPSPLEVLLPLRTSGRSRPLFCIHPAGGLSWSYSALMQHLPAGHPIYGLQARGIPEPQMNPQTLDEMAADYLASIRQLQPNAPYNLLGWSFGGPAAHSPPP